MSDPVSLAGSVAFVVTIVYQGLGLPSQIASNRRRRSVQGLSLLMYLLMCLCGISWVVYAALQRPVDWYIAGSNSVGVLFSAVILGQFWVYRGRRADS